MCLPRLACYATDIKHTIALEFQHFDKKIEQILEDIFTNKTVMYAVLKCVPSCMSDSAHVAS